APYNGRCIPRTHRQNRAIFQASRRLLSGLKGRARYRTNDNKQSTATLNQATTFLTAPILRFRSSQIWRTSVRQFTRSQQYCQGFQVLQGAPPLRIAMAPWRRWNQRDNR